MTSDIARMVMKELARQTTPDLARTMPPVLSDKLTPEEYHEQIVCLSALNKMVECRDAANKVLLEMALGNSDAIPAAEPVAPEPPKEMVAAKLHPDEGEVRSKLSLTYDRAYQQYVSIERLRGEVTDKEAYEWLKREGDNVLPPFGTWARYLREARRHYATQKNTPRAGRMGRSIVQVDEIECQKKKGYED